MNVNRCLSVYSLALAAAIAAPATVQAQIATGTTGSFEYRFPNFGTTGFGPSVFTVGDGLELSSVSYGNILWSIDLNADAQTMTITANDAGCCTNAVDFSGWVVQFDQPLLGAAGSVALQSTNISSFGADRVTNTANSIAVSFGSGLDLRDNRFVVLRLSSASVPEPHALALVMVGFAGLAIRARRKARLDPLRVGQRLD